jgi:hypothetical protein
MSLMLVAACSVEGHYVLPDVDALPETPTAVHVSPSGDDANDGLERPVRTLKRGVGIAAANAAITGILVAAGRYDAASGETFPYTVPAHVEVAGPAGGGVILAGTSTEPGLVIETGALRDLELESFTVAVISKGTAQLANLRVRSSGTAIRAEAASKLTATKLDLAGTPGACATGFELNGDADLTASEVSTRALGVAFKIKDQATSSISKADVTGDATCQAASFDVRTTKTFALDRSFIDGGFVGISFYEAVTPTLAAVTNTILRNMALDGVAGRTVAFTMTGGELSNNQVGITAVEGTWTLNNVVLNQNRNTGIYVQGGGTASPTTLTMRGCTLANSSTGVYLVNFAAADLGTVANPGNNAFLANTTLGLHIDLFNGPTLINAVGNTWRPGVQGSDAAGRYPVVAAILGPIDPGYGGNFRISAGSTLQR